MLEAGFKDCGDSTGKPYNLEENASVSAYRPHHGIHLGIFRSPLLIEAEKSLISSAMYCGYYNKFKELKLKESYMRISSGFTEHINKLIDNMETYYSQLKI